LDWIKKGILETTAFDDISSLGQQEKGNIFGRTPLHAFAIPKAVMADLTTGSKLVQAFSIQHHSYDFSARGRCLTNSPRKALPNLGCNNRHTHARRTRTPEHFTDCPAGHVSPPQAEAPCQV
jgi:hypothetical protein